MGSTTQAEEAPPHAVTIARPFAMSVYEVSNAEYRRFCEQTSQRCPEQPWGDGYPVVLIDWFEAVEYARWLSATTGYVYRLPTEAEWEYAARGGTKTPYPFGDKVLLTDARFSERSAADSPLAQGDNSVNRNGFRLYHIVGNVREWVADEWYEDHKGAPADGSARLPRDDTRRVVRGGSYADPMPALRSAARQPLAANSRDRTTGFRLVRELSP